MYKVKINRILDATRPWWNEARCWVMEEFGQQGDGYTITMTRDFMIYNFTKQEDAALVALHWGNN